MSWQERRCNAEGFGRPEPFFFLCEERTYSPPAKQAVVSLPSVRLVRSARRMRLLREPPDNATSPAGAAVIACGAQSGMVQNEPPTSAPCENLPPAAFSQLWTELAARPFSFSEKKQKQGYAVSAYPGKDVIYYGNLSFGSKGRKPWSRSKRLRCGGVYELFCHL